MTAATDKADKAAADKTAAATAATADAGFVLNIKLGQSGTAIATFQDATQHPPVSYPLAFPAVWTCDTPGILLTPVADGTKNGVATCTVGVQPNQPPGPFKLTCTGEAEKPAGSKKISGDLAGAAVETYDNAVVMSGTLP